jgi:hypothetical protein
MAFPLPSSVFCSVFRGLAPASTRKNFAPASCLIADASRIEQFRQFKKETLIRQQGIIPAIGGIAFGRSSL